MSFGIKNTTTIPLWPDGVPECGLEDVIQPSLDIYLVENDTPRGAVLICPGGGYSHLAPHEGHEIAKHFNNAGLHAFVVKYRVKPHIYPAPLLDASKALKLIQDNAALWNIISNRIAVCGFSAGGHLAACLGLLWDSAKLRWEKPLKYLDRGPDAIILCYPVISSGVFAHKDSFRNLLGENVSEEMWHKMSLELQVKNNTPPAFLWHTFNDEAVPVENTLLFAKALREHDISFELHIYAKGVHGLGISADDSHIATWMPLCCQWLKEKGW